MFLLYAAHVECYQGCVLCLCLMNVAGSLVYVSLQHWGLHSQVWVDSGLVTVNRVKLVLHGGVCSVTALGCMPPLMYNKTVPIIIHLQHEH